MSRIADMPVALLQWVNARLAASAALAVALGVDQDDVLNRVWDETPPDDAEEPFILVTVGPASDVGAVGTVEVMARSEVTVKAVAARESFASAKAGQVPLSPVSVAVHGALQGHVGSAIPGGGTVLSSRRLRTVAYAEQAQGTEYRHLGGTYEVYAQ